MLTLKINVSAIFYCGAVKLINSMFPLHVFHYSSCLYLSSVETRSLEEQLGNNNQRTNIAFWHYASGPPPRRGPPRAYFDFIFIFYNPRSLRAGWTDVFYTSWGRWPGGSRIRITDCDSALVVPAKVTCQEGWLSFLNSFEIVGTLVVYRPRPRAPQGALESPRGSLGASGPLWNFQGRHSPGDLHGSPGARPPRLARSCLGNLFNLFKIFGGKTFGAHLDVPEGS